MWMLKHVHRVYIRRLKNELYVYTYINPARTFDANWKGRNYKTGWGSCAKHRVYI